MGAAKWNENDFKNLFTSNEMDTSQWNDTNFRNIFTSNESNISQYNATNFSTISPPPESSPYSYSYTVTILVICGTVLMSCVTLFNNMLVLLSYKLERKLRTPNNYFLVSLAVSDVLVGLVLMPFGAVYFLYREWPLPHVLCDLFHFLDLFICNASQLCVFVITVDRFCSIWIPNKYRTWRRHKQALTMISLHWVIPFSIFAPLIFIYQRHTITNRRTDECEVEFLDDPLTGFLVSIIDFWLPTLVMFLMYAYMFNKANTLSEGIKARQTEGKQHGEQKGSSFNTSIFSRNEETGSITVTIKEEQEFKDIYNEFIRSSSITVNGETVTNNTSINYTKQYLGLSLNFSEKVKEDFGLIKPTELTVGSFIHKKLSSYEGSYVWSNSTKKARSGVGYDSANINNSSDNRSANINNSSDNRSANINNSSDNRSANINNSSDNRSANINNSSDNRSANINNSSDNRSANINNSSDNRSANINNSSDNRSANINNSSDNRSANINYSSDNRSANINNSSENRSANMNNSSDNRSANINSSSDNRSTSVDGVTPNAYFLKQHSAVELPRISIHPEITRPANSIEIVGPVKPSSITRPADSLEITRSVKLSSITRPVPEISRPANLPEISRTVFLSKEGSSVDEERSIVDPKYQGCGTIILGKFSIGKAFCEMRVVNVKSLSTVVIILGSFAICWFPYHILLTAYAVWHMHVPTYVWHITHYMCYFYSTINPFVYAYANPIFRRAYQRILSLDFRKNVEEIEKQAKNESI